MSTAPNKSKFGDPAPPRVLVAVPATDRTRRARGRLIAAGAFAVGLALAVTVAVVALVDRGNGPSTPGHASPAASPAKSVVLPYVVGAHQELATSTLQGEGFAVEVRTVRSASPAGAVVAETPTGGRPVASGTHVTLTVSSGS